jgi:branched-chain amino acid aminotransferase
MVYQLFMKKKVKVIVSRKVRNVWNGAIAQAKISGKYMLGTVAKMEAEDKGCLDAILLDNRNMVTEATSSNVFIVKDGALKTPGIDHALTGITRTSVIEIAKKMGIAVKEEDITCDELFDADEVFLSNTARGILSVSEIDAKTINNKSGKSPVDAIRDKYLDIIRGNDPDYKEWLTEV